LPHAATHSVSRCPTLSPTSGMGWAPSQQGCCCCCSPQRLPPRWD
jgi:hypothetical protein